MIFFILPTYNEALNIEEIITNLRKNFAKLPYKIIAVNDGSTDKTLKILQRLKKRDLLIESYKVNMNIGTVFSTGINRAILESKNDNDIVIIMEADKTSSIETVDIFLEKLKKGADIVIASRYQPGGRYENFPLARRIYSFGANKLMQIIFHLPKVKDYTIFFRAYKIAVIKKAFEFYGPFGIIQLTGFTANAEFLVKLSFLTKKIEEVPFIYNYGRKKGKSKIKIISTVVEYFELIFYMSVIKEKLLKRKLIH